VQDWPNSAGAEFSYPLSGSVTVFGFAVAIGIVVVFARDRPKIPHQLVILFILSIHVDEFLGVHKSPVRRITDMDEQDGQDGDRMERGAALLQRIPITIPMVDTE
jgi:hypothetical protein